MRYPCWFCGQSVTTEVPDDTVIRALLVCPECLERGEIVIHQGERPERTSGMETARAIAAGTRGR